MTSDTSQPGEDMINKNFLGTVTPEWFYESNRLPDSILMGLMSYDQDRVTASLKALEELCEFDRPKALSILEEIINLREAYNVDIYHHELFVQSLPALSRISYLSHHILAHTPYAMSDQLLSWLASMVSSEYDFITRLAFTALVSKVYSLEEARRRLGVIEQIANAKLTRLLSGYYKFIICIHDSLENDTFRMDTLLIVTADMMEMVYNAANDTFLSSYKNYFARLDRVQDNCDDIVHLFAKHDNRILPAYDRRLISSLKRRLEHNQPSVKSPS
ncbi:MAG: hypothetical protein ACRCZF_07125 [Gemmataceae bacterium]